MQLHQIIKTIRENKKLSQVYLAYELGIDQSQYCRREKGEIQFVPNEIVKLSKVLEISISNLFNEIIEEKRTSMDKNISIPEKLIEQYELRIKEKEEMIQLLINQIKGQSA